MRERSNTKLFFSCIVCKEAVKPHNTGSDGSSAHFEHYVRNYTCPHSEGKSEGQSKVQSRYPTDSADSDSADSDSAREGYSKDDEILASTR